jgi:2-dehydropantoate 2-reductase
VRTLVLGAGAIGGYFGGRLAQAGREVTFLVRPPRAERLQESGLQIRSPHGDATIQAPATVIADTLREPYDLIILSNKAYDLDDAIAAIAPAVGPKTAILPLLNGMRHLDVLDERFGAQHVLGGQCFISTVLDPDGRIVQLSDMQLLSFGERDGTRSERVEAIAAEFSGANFESVVSSNILQEMWEKWVFIATNAGITSLMRGAIGEIVAADAADLPVELLNECAAIAASYGFAPRPEVLERNRAMLTAPGSPLTASMFRDIERGARIEAYQIVGDLRRRGIASGISAPLLRVVEAHLGTYEVRLAATVGDPAPVSQRA